MLRRSVLGHEVRAGFPALRRLAAVALIVAAGCAPIRRPHEHQYRTGCANDLQRLGVDIVGAKAIPPDVVACWIASDNPAWASRRRFEEQDVDGRRVGLWYRTKGYLEAKVVVRTVELASGEKRVRVEVVEGREARVAAMKLEGLDDFPDSKGWIAVLPLKVGARFEEEPYLQSYEMVTVGLCGAGYPDAHVEHGTDVDPNTLDVRIGFVAFPGQRAEPCRATPVFVMGSNRVPRQRIRAEAERVLPPGEPLDITKLGTIRERVMAMREFEYVEVTLGERDEHYRVPVVVRVRELLARTPPTTIVRLHLGLAAVAGGEFCDGIEGQCDVWNDEANRMAALVRSDVAVSIGERIRPGVPVYLRPGLQWLAGPWYSPSVSLLEPFLECVASFAETQFFMGLGGVFTNHGGRGAMFWLGIGGTTSGNARSGLGGELGIEIGGFGGNMATGMRLSGGPELRF